MNEKLVFKITGFILMLEGAAMLLPLLTALLHKEDDTYAFLVSLLLTVGIGGLVYWLCRKESGSMYTREAFMVVGLSWTVLSLFGALPYYLSNAITDPFDCMFEAMSGFTTSGATVIADIEALPYGVLLWRSMTHWLGGLGVLILFLALLPSMGGRTQSLLKAEASGPTPAKIVPRIAETAKIMYTIYTGMTAVLIILLMVSGLPFFHALTVSFSTAATGGLAITNLSIGTYGNPLVEIIIAVFMLLFSVNFTVYHAVITKKWSYIKSNTELKWFGGIVGGAVVIIWINIMGSTGAVTGLRQSLFHVAAIISSTGFSTVDYNLWPELSKMILVILMITGSCGGSTAGGVKIARIAILFKAVRREIKKIVHPRSTPIVRMNGKAADESVITTALLFFAVYVIVIFCASVLVSFDNLGFETTLTAVIASIGNTGPGLGLSGPMSNFSIFSPLSKVVLSACMLIGRLEIFPLLVIFSPAAWTKK